MPFKSAKSFLLSDLKLIQHNYFFNKSCFDIFIRIGDLLKWLSKLVSLHYMHLFYAPRLPKKPHLISNFFLEIKFLIKFRFIQGNRYTAFRRPVIYNNNLLILHNYCILFLNLFHLHWYEKLLPFILNNILVFNFFLENDKN